MKIALLAAATVLVATGAQAAPFATFSSSSGSSDFRLVNTGDGTRTKDAVLYSTTSSLASGPGSPIVSFSFLDPLLTPYVTNASAIFTYNASVALNSPAFYVSRTVLEQPAISGSFSFLTTSFITVGAPGLNPHTYAAGSNLLSGTFTNAAIIGSNNDATFSGSTSSGYVVSFTSDFLDFSGTTQRDIAFVLSSITPALSRHDGTNLALNSFDAAVSGQFSADPSPIVNGVADPAPSVPEPATWAMMIAGIALVGRALRRPRSMLTRFS